MRQLFQHLHDDPEELKRAKVALILFGLILSMCIMALAWAWKDQSRKSEDRISAVKVQVNNFAELKNHANDRQWLEKQAINIFHTIYDRLPNNTNNNDYRTVQKLSFSYLQPILQNNSLANKKIISNSVEFATQKIHDQLPILRFKTALFAWVICGIIYWLLILSLYATGLRPTKGEPVFNIIDVGFIAILVEYTGGLSSSFLIVFGFSLFLSATDFVHQEKLPAHSNNGFLKKLFIIIGPYITALIIAIFWSVSDGIMLHGDSIKEYITRWALISLFASLCWTFCYAGMKLKSDKS